MNKFSIKISAAGEPEVRLNYHLVEAFRVVDPEYDPIHLSSREYSLEDARRLQVEIGGRIEFIGCYWESGFEPDCEPPKRFNSVDSAKEFAEEAWQGWDFSASWIPGGKKMKFSILLSLAGEPEERGECVLAHLGEEFFWQTPEGDCLDGMVFPSKLEAERWAYSSYSGSAWGLKFTYEE